jgi:hypothetical protein
MTDINGRCFVKRGSALYPSDPFSEEMLSKLKDGHEVVVTIRKPRSLSQLRWLFALLRKVVENSDRWADENVLLDDLKLATGLFETRVSALTGLPYPIPASISFSAMPADRFGPWLEKAIAVLARDVLSVSPESLRGEIFAMLDGKTTASCSTRKGDNHVTTAEV